MLGEKDNHYEQNPSFVVTAQVNGIKRIMAVFADDANHAQVVFLSNLALTDIGELKVVFLSIEGEFTKGKAHE